jgi:hypothetical protein
MLRSYICIPSKYSVSIDVDIGKKRANNKINIVKTYEQAATAI